MGGKKNRGFTLFELMVVIAVVGVIAAIAIPSFRTMQQNARMTGAANDLLSSINLARSEAIKRQQTVGFCTSANPRAATPTCTAPLANDTTIGWVTWLDPDADGVLEGGEEILGTHDPLDPAVSLSSNWSTLNYGVSGFVAISPALAPSTPATLVICDERSNAVVGDLLRRRVLTVSPTGRPAVLRTVSSVDGLAVLGDAVVTDCP